MATKDRGQPPRRAGSRGSPGGGRSNAATERGRKARPPADRAPTGDTAQSSTTGGAKTPTEGTHRRRTRRTVAGEAQGLPAASAAQAQAVTPSGGGPESAAAGAAHVEPEIPPEVVGQVETRSSEEALEEPAAAAMRGARRDRHRTAHANALGLLIERQFADPGSPCHSYSDLERRSGISREALSRYVTSRADRRRSPTIDTLVAIADALHVSLEGVARAAAASVKGITPPPDEVMHVREEALSSLVAGLSDAQFNAVVELLRQLGPWRGSAT
jgi:transcriptional regulator with XRE-family HTH domain